MAKLTKEEIKYYKGDGDFLVDDAVYDTVGDDYNKIEWLAMQDIANRNKRKTLKDFKNAAEYEVYKAVLFDEAVAAEFGAKYRS